MPTGYKMTQSEVSAYGGPVERDHFAVWGSDEVCRWLAEVGLSQYAPRFRDHKIMGRVLPSIEERHLREMGVDIVGDRVRLLAEARRLATHAVQANRFKVLWEGAAPRFTKGPLDWCWQWCVCRPVWAEVNRYKLTANSLVVTINQAGWCCNMLERKRFERNVDLSNVAGVNLVTSSKVRATRCGARRCRAALMQPSAAQLCDCGCVATELNVELDSDKGMADLPPIYVAKDHAQRVCHLMMDAMEEVQSMECHGGQPGAPLTIARG